MEVMGLMLGEFVDDYTVKVVDVFAMPQARRRGPASSVPSLARRQGPPAAPRRARGPPAAHVPWRESGAARPAGLERRGSRTAPSPPRLP